MYNVSIGARLAGKASASAYDASSTKRRVNKTWVSRLGNSDTDDLPSLEDLRVKSRDAYRNQPLVRGAVDTKLYNTIGSGLVMQSQPNHEVIGISEEAASDWAKNTEFYFRLWASNKNCDAERTKNFGNIQGVAFISTLLSGDISALLPHIDRGSLFSLSVQLIEADRLSNPGISFQDNEKTAGGITVGEYGEPVTYHFNKYHPGGISFKNEWVAVPAYGRESGRPNVIHLAARTRPHQRRGVPVLAPVLESLKVLSEYTTAELEAALISGLFTVFVKTESGELPEPPLTTEADGTDDRDDNTMELAPGMMVGLKEGESIDTANPGRPNTAYDAFVMSIIKQIGSALQVPYELLIKHFSSSYSASRAALLEAWKAFKTRRTWFAGDFCQPIYEEWLHEAVLSGVISAPGFLENEAIRAAYCQASWNGPQPGMLNPTAETQAAIMRVEAGFSTRTKEASEMNGTDFETNAMIAKRENALIEDSGLRRIDNSKVEKVEMEEEKSNE